MKIQIKIAKLARADGYQVDDEQEERILAFLEMLHEWAGKISLISLKARENLWEDHLCECLWLNEVVGEPEEVVDFGSGAGFPGMIIACMRPGTKVRLIEQRVKKAVFLRYVKDNIPLLNVYVLNEKIQKQINLKGNMAGNIVTRAAGQIFETLNTVSNLAERDCRLFALIGKENIKTFGYGCDMIKSIGWEKEKLISRSIYGKEKGILILRKI